jgi:hypothetical protein
MHIRIAAAVAAALALSAGGAVAATSSAGASNLGHRPGAAVSGASATVTAGFSPFSEKFSTGQGNFCDNASDAPCDGNAGAGDYGTVSGAIPVSFSDYGYGNYAQSVAPLPTSTGTISKTAVLGGSTAANQGAACPTAGTEGCTGPYLEPQGQNQYAWPTNGYTFTAYQWIDPAYTAAAGNANGAGTQIDTDLGIDQSTGSSGGTSYGQDEVITTCNNSDGTASLAFGNGSPGACGTGSQITSAGWYRYVWVLSSLDGKVSVTARVLSADGSTLLFDSGPQPVSFGGLQATTSDTGGMRYVWWPTLNVDGLRVAAAFYQGGQHLNGHAA